MSSSSPQLDCIINFLHQHVTLSSQDAKKTLFEILKINHVHEPNDFTLSLDDENAFHLSHVGFQKIPLTPYKDTSQFPNCETLLDLYQFLINRKVLVQRLYAGGYFLKAEWNPPESVLQNRNHATPLPIEHLIQMDFERCIRVEESNSNLDFSEIAYDFGKFNLLPLNSDSNNQYMCCMAQREAMRLRVRNLHDSHVALFITLNGHSFLQSPTHHYHVIAPGTTTAIEGLMKTQEDTSCLHQLVTCPLEEDKDMILRIEVWPLKRRDFKTFTSSPALKNAQQMDMKTALSSIRDEDSMIYFQNQSLFGKEKLLRVHTLLEALSDMRRNGKMDKNPELRMHPQFLVVHVRVSSEEEVITVKIPIVADYKMDDYSLPLEDVVGYLYDELKLGDGEGYALYVNQNYISKESQSTQRVYDGSLVEFERISVVSNMDPSTEPLAKLSEALRKVPEIKVKAKPRAAKKKNLMSSFSDFRFKRARSSVARRAAAPPPPASNLRSSIVSSMREQAAPAPPPPTGFAFSAAAEEDESDSSWNDVGVSDALSLNMRMENIELTNQILMEEEQEEEEEDYLSKPLEAQYENPSAVYGASLRALKHPVEEAKRSNHRHLLNHVDEWDREHGISMEILLKTSQQWKRLGGVKPGTSVSAATYASIGLKVPEFIQEQYLREK